MPVQRTSDDRQGDENAIPIRTILLLCDEWNDDRVEGLTAINKSLALSLTGFEGVRVCCTTFGGPGTARQAGATNDNGGQVELLSLTGGVRSEPAQLYKTFNETPQKLWTGSVHDKIPEASFIVGHFPGTAEAAVNLRDSTYPSSKVILFYHIVPEDVEWLAEKLPYVVPTDDGLVRLAERADVVYSVTKQVHSFFEAKFRNRAQKAVDHRLFLPQWSKEVFDVDPERERNYARDGLRILVLSRGTGIEEWQGLDIAACAAAKVASVLKDRGGPRVTLTVGNVDRAQKERVRAALAPFLEGTELRLEVKAYADAKEQLRDTARHHLCLVPSRAEPYGATGLLSISAGIPTVVAEDFYTATIIRRLTTDPRHFLVRTTRDSKAVRQDAGLWKDRILELMEDKMTVERAFQLKMAAKRDEPTIQTHDNFTSYCLRGIRLKVEVGQLKFSSREESDGEAATRRRFSAFILSLLKQSWRLKRHSLVTSTSDLPSILPGIKLPVEKVTKHVTDKIEDMGRRILETDEAGGSLIVYCPGRKALRDLWSMGDRINKALAEVIFKDDQLTILKQFKLEAVTTRFAIPGPEYLRHNEELLLETS